MEAKGREERVRFPGNAKRYVTKDGETLRAPLLPDNVPRISGRRTHQDEKFLETNNGKLHKLAIKL